MEKKRKIQIAGITTVVVLLLLAWLATEPFKLSDGELPIERKTRWIEVPGDPIAMEFFVGEGQTINQSWDFPEPYISHITVYLIWVDDGRTEQDTFYYRVLNGTGDQRLAAGSNNGQVYTSTPLENNAVRHIENNEGWNIEVTCSEARDGFIGPAGIITIPDDGNDVTIRIEWEHFIEHNPDWL
jgi:hypothetical protein